MAEKVEAQPKPDIKPVHEEPVETPPQSSNASDKPAAQNETKASEDKPVNQTEKIDKKPTVTIVKDKITFVEKKNGPQILQGEKLKESHDK